jgi:hypothetical protein
MQTQKRGAKLMPLIIFETLLVGIVFFVLFALAFGPYITGLMKKKNSERRICPLADKNCKGCFYWLESGDVCYYPKMINGLGNKKNEE